MTATAKRHGWRVLALVVAISSTVTQALDSVGVVAGKGLNDVLIQSGSIASTEMLGVDLRWQTDWAEVFSWAEVDQTFINLQLANWSGEHQGRRQHMNAFALTALWRWRADDGWFVDAGVGGSRLGEDSWEEVTLSGRTQFALDFAFGKQVAENWEWSLRYRHYSNGYTASPNPGLDGAVILLSYRP